MADFPSTPQFGGLPYSQWPSLATSQQQNQQGHNSASAFPTHLHPASVAYPHIPTNNTAFEENSRIPGLGGIFAPPPPSFPPEVLKQFASSPLPHPPLPPISAVQTQPQSIPGLGAASAVPTRSPPDETLSQLPDPTSNAPDINGDVKGEVATTREEGELSDGELEEDDVNTGDWKSDNDTMGNTMEKQTSAISEPSLSDDEGSMSSYNPPSASSVDHFETPQSSAMQQEVTSAQSIDTLANLKAKAKGAILSLLPHNITFQDLVKEGIDEGILRQLYEETGMDGITTKAKDVEHIQAHNGGPSPSAAGGVPIPDISAVAPTTFATPSLSTLSRINPTAATVPTPRPATPLSDSAITKAGVERKDRIAQLLALKAVKSAKSQSPANTSSEIPLALGKASKEQDVSAIQGRLAGPGPVSTPGKTESPSQEQANKKKNKAQTELVRAKMEALRQQALAKAQAHNKSTITAPGVSAPSDALSKALAQPSKVFAGSDTGKTPHKRPLASDLFEETGPAAKRPVGRKSSSDKAEIVISEDEGEISDDADMDIDHSSDLERGEIRGTSRAASDKIATSTLASSKPVVPPTRPSKALPVSKSTTPTREKVQDELISAKNEEIARMRRHIIEMEQRRKTKQNMSSQSQSPAPVTPGPVVLTQSTTPTKQFGRDLTPVSGLLTRLSDASPRTSESTNAGTPTTAAAARAEALRKRLVRRKELQAGLPLLDAEVERTRSRLAELEHEAEQLRAEIEKGVEGRQGLLRELEMLGVDTDSTAVERMRLPELKATRDELLEAQQSRLEASNKAQNEVFLPQAKTETAMMHEGSDIPAGLSTSVEAIVATTTPSMTKKDGNQDMSMQKPQQTIENQLDEVSEPQCPLEDTAMDEGSSAGSSMDESSGSSDEDSDSDMHGVEVAELAADAREETTTISPTIEAQVSFGMQNGDLTNIDESKPASLVAGEGDESGSVSMSDSASESTDDYEPADNVIDGDVVVSKHDADVSIVDEVSDEGYEPPKNVSAVVEKPVQAISHEDPQSTVPDRETSQELTEANTMIKAQDTEEPVEEIPQMGLDKSKFVPYESPLRTFRNYRFHPEFLREVIGGYRSLTYSCKIDPFRMLCETEAKGEVCQDPSCDDQHFAQMGLPDDKILVELSGAPGMERDLRNRYVNGLKTVIADLRTRGVKDFEEVASELAAYRRRFEADEASLLGPPPVTNGAVVSQSVDKIAAASSVES